jgi:tetratricopeptide (TPR) repeat protein
MNTTQPSQGSITGQSLLGLISALNRRRASGALRIFRGAAGGTAEKTFYFERGEVYAAASNAPEDSVLSVLVRVGRLDEARAAEIERQVLAGRDFREALLDDGCVTAEGFAVLRITHVSAVFHSACEWRQGRYEFVEGARVVGGPLGCDTMTLILGEARRAAVPEAFRHLAIESRRHIVRTRAEAAPLHVSLTPREEYLLELLHMPLTTEALCRTAVLSEQEIWQGLYALNCAGLIAFTPLLQARAEWVAVVGQEERPAVAPAAQAMPAVEPPVAVAPSSDSAAVVVEGVQVVAPAATETASAITADAIAASAETPFESSAEVEIEADLNADIETIIAAAASAELPTPTPEEARAARLREARQEVEKIKAVLASARDDYEVLGLQSGVAPTQVRQSFRRLVARYHPDRFQQYADAETLAELNGIVSVLRQAYETATEHAMLHAVLTTARARAASAHESVETNGAVHPLTPDAPANRRMTALQSAAEKYREAVLLQQRGDRVEALRLMREAVRLDSRNAQYQAYLASLLMRDQNQRREAEAHLLRAVELEPQSITYRLQLGQFYRAQGLLPQAEQQLRIALKLNPYHQAVILELREIGALKRPAPQPSSSGRRASAKPAGLFARLFRRATKV